MMIGHEKAETNQTKSEVLVNKRFEKIPQIDFSDQNYSLCRKFADILDTHYTRAKVLALYAIKALFCMANLGRFVSSTNQDNAQYNLDVGPFETFSHFQVSK